MVRPFDPGQTQKDIRYFLACQLNLRGNPPFKAWLGPRTVPCVYLPWMVWFVPYRPQMSVSTSIADPCGFQLFELRKMWVPNLGYPCALCGPGVTRFGRTPARRRSWKRPTPGLAAAARAQALSSEVQITTSPGTERCASRSLRAFRAAFPEWVCFVHLGLQVDRQAEPCGMGDSGGLPRCFQTLECGSFCDTEVVASHPAMTCKP